MKERTLEKKETYIDKVHKKMQRRGFMSEEIPLVIGKTGFISALNEYPEEHMHKIG